MTRRSFSTCTLLLALVGAPALGLAQEDVAGKKIQTISEGGRVDLHRHLEVGKYVIFEFYDDNWSPGGLELSAKIERQVRRADDILLKRIWVPSWHAPALGQHRVTALPHYKFYDRTGQLMKQFSPEDATNAPPVTRASPTFNFGGATGASPYVPKVKTISNGETVDIKDHLAKGQHTVVYFYADW